MNDLLLAGQPIQIDFFYIHPWKLKDIINPKNEYYQNLFLFFLRKEDLPFSEDLLKNMEGYNVFDLIRVGAIWGKAFQEQFLKALNMFTQEDFIFIDGNFKLNEHILTHEHWEKIKTILAEENYLDLNKLKPEEEEYNLANSKAAEFRKRAAETRRLVEKYKKKKEVTLGFLINRFCAKSPNLNLLNVWDLTFYQFKQQFDAILSIEQYDFNMTALLQGRLDTKKQKIVHWTENN